MPTNLPSTTNVGQVNVCLLRAARLNSDCSPTGGNNGGIVTVGIGTLTATPDIEQGTSVRPKNGCGNVMYSIRPRDSIVGFNLQGDIVFFDNEAAELLFGGSTILGGAGSDFSGDVIGWAAPGESEGYNNGVYLEVFSQSIGQGAGDCQGADTSFPAFTGHIFGKVRLTPGEATLQEGEIRQTFTGYATQNPNLYDGPWNDWPGDGYIRTAAYQRVGYSNAEFEAILALAAAGYVDLAAAS